MGFLDWIKGAARSVGNFFKPAVNFVGDLARPVIHKVGELIRNPRQIPKAIGDLSRNIIRPAVNMLGFIPHPKAQLLAAGGGKVLDSVEDISGKVDKAVN